MKPSITFKCLHCNEQHRCDYRNRGRQRYCAKPDCRRVSRASSQRRWLSRPENENYFRGADNCERVRQWRKSHPDYWRNKKPEAPGTLQDTCTAQSLGQQALEPPRPQSTLQDICHPQPALLVGLISMVTGHALQEDIAASTRSFLTRGEDILRMTPRGPEFPSYENQTCPLSRTFAACASPV